MRGLRGGIVDDNLAVEHMGKLFLVHAYACIADRHLHIIVSLGGRYINMSLVGKLTGIVSQGVQHKEGQYAVGLHHSLRRLHTQFHAFHLEALTTAGHHVEQRLQGETLNTQAQLSLLQLYPMGKHFIVSVHLVNQLTDIG